MDPELPTNMATTGNVSHSLFVQSNVGYFGQPPDSFAEFFNRVVTAAPPTRPPVGTVWHHPALSKSFAYIGDGYVTRPPCIYPGWVELIDTPAIQITREVTQSIVEDEQEALESIRETLRRREGK